MVVWRRRADRADVFRIAWRTVGRGVGVPGDVLEPSDGVVTEAVVIDGRGRERGMQGKQHRFTQEAHDEYRRILHDFPGDRGGPQSPVHLLFRGLSWRRPRPVC